MAVDAAPLIYLVQGHSTFGTKTRELWAERAAAGRDVIASSLVIAEILPLPLRRGDDALVKVFKDLYAANGPLRLVDPTPRIFERAAELRASLGLRTPDAVHLATAVVSGATEFLTNDRNLARVTGIQVIVLADVVGKGA